MELRDIRGVLRSQRLVVIGMLVAGLGVAAALSLWVLPRSYSSTTGLFLSVATPTTTGTTAATDPASAALADDSFARARAVSYVQILTSEQTAQRVVADLDLPMTAKQLAGKISAAPAPDTVIIDVTVTDSSATRAQAIATAVGREFRSTVASLDPRVTVQTVQSADLDTTPVSPNLPLNLGLGAAIGLVLGIALVLLRAQLSTTVHSDRELREITGAPAVCTTFRHRRGGDLFRAAAKRGLSFRVEAYRAVGLALQHAEKQQRPRVVVITSCLPGEGKTTVAVNTARSLARSGRRVLLVEANLWRPRLARALDLPEAGGLTDVLAGRRTFQDVVHTVEGGRLHLLGAGSPSAHPAEILHSAGMAALLRSLRDHYDLVLVDTPGVLSATDATALSSAVDGYLVVARYGKTRRDQLTEAVAAIARVHGAVLVAVLNAVPLRVTTTRRRKRTYRPDRKRAIETPAASVPATPDEELAEVHRSGPVAPAASA